MSRPSYVTPRGVICRATRPGPGRPKNSRPKLIAALREALDEDETLGRLRAVAIERLEAGDPSFWKMILDRLWPARSEITGADGEPVFDFASLARQAEQARRDRQLED